MAAGALMAVVLAAAGACSSSTSSTSSTPAGSGTPNNSSTASTSSSAAVLGTKDPAKGQPVKIGYLVDGKTAATDNAAEEVLAPALARYLNDYRGGIGGRPIQLETCTTNGDPAKATVCANQMVQDHVVAVVIGALGEDEAAWRPLHQAKIPEFTGTVSPAPLTDPTGVFGLEDPLSSVVNAPAALAKSKGLGKVTQVVIDVPSATVFMKTVGPAMFKAKGLQFAFVAVPRGTADMTPQMQQLASGNPGVVQIIGDDTFCTAALEGLKAVGFKGTISVISNCVTDATRKAMGSFLNGVVMTATSPSGDNSDPDMKLFGAIVNTYDKGGISPADAGADMLYTSMMAMGAVLHDLTGPITPATVTAHVKAMPLMPLPLGGGLTFRCNGKADPLLPAVCTTGMLVTTLNSSGLPTTYKPVGG
jgi:branched-chain amino acid transport system substrate-binding protein